MSIIIGSEFCSNKFGMFKIVDYCGNNKFLIEFDVTGYRSVEYRSNILKGNVKDYLQPTVYGFGVSGKKYDKTDNIGKFLKQYDLWQGMIRRCYSNNKPKSYENCTVSDYFKYYCNFYDWCNEQVGFKVQGFEIDKDLLMKGNKEYHENLCVFIPNEINTFLTNRRNHRGIYPIGVKKKSKNESYQSSISKKGRIYHLGYFNTPEEAFYAYKKAKEDYAKELAYKWKDQIDPRAFEALMNYEVDIND